MNGLSANSPLKLNPISAELAGLHNELKNLEDHFSQLTKRLELIMPPATQNPPTPANEAMRPFSSQISSEIWNAARRIRQIRDGIQELLEKLEI